MVKVKCSVPNCQFETDDASEALVIAILANHGLAHLNSQPVAPVPETRATKSGHRRDNRRVERICSPLGRFPEWDQGSDEASAPSQLFSMCRDRARRQPSKGQPKAASDTLPELLAAMRSLAVIPIATGVLRTELLQLQQERDEPFRALQRRCVEKQRLASLRRSASVAKRLTILTIPYGTSS